MSITPSFGILNIPNATIRAAAINTSVLNVTSDINFTGNLFKNSNLFVSSLWISNTTTNSLTYTAGNVGIGTTSPVEQLHLTGNLRVDGATHKYYLEYNYQAIWDSNNNQTFTIPVSGTTYYGLMLVEAKVIQVAANSSGKKVARVKGLISNYNTGNHYMTVVEGENIHAFETYIVGTSLSATGTFTMKYQPAEGYLQNVNCVMYLKILIGGGTNTLGSLTRTDTGSNTTLTEPTFYLANQFFGGSVVLGKGGVMTSTILCKMQSDVMVATSREVCRITTGTYKFFIVIIPSGDNSCFGLSFDVIIHKGQFGPAEINTYNACSHVRDGSGLTVTYTWNNGGSHTEGNLEIGLVDNSVINYEVRIICVGVSQSAIPVLQKLFTDVW